MPKVRYYKDMWTDISACTFYIDLPPLSLEHLTPLIVLACIVGVVVIAVVVVGIIIACRVRCVREKCKVSAYAISRPNASAWLLVVMNCMQYSIFCHTVENLHRIYPWKETGYFHD